MHLAESAESLSESIIELQLVRTIHSWGSKVRDERLAANANIGCVDEGCSLPTGLSDPTSRFSMQSFDVISCSEMNELSEQHSHISRILTNPRVLEDPKSFFEVYEAPIRKFFACIGGSSHDADEYFQEFAVKFLSGSFDGFSPDKGRFRDYLKASLRNQVRRSYNHAKHPVPIPDDHDAEDVNAIAPVEAALKEFDTMEGEQIKQLVDNDMRDEEEQGLNHYHSLLRFAIEHQQKRVSEFAETGGKAKIPVKTLVEFLSKRDGQDVTLDTAKQRMFRAKTTFAAKIISEIGVRIGDSSEDAIREAAQELGLSVYIEAELSRRKNRVNASITN